jgi:hypothetical protein
MAADPRREGALTSPGRLATVGGVVDEHRHLACPFCESYSVERLYLASLDLDSCACAACGGRWDERAGSGDFAGRGSATSVFARRSR